MKRPDSYAFIESFVDACTVRPFYNDLKQLKQMRLAFGELPSRTAPVPAAAAAVAAEHGFASPEIHEMPANNLFVVFGR